MDFRFQSYSNYAPNIFQNNANIMILFFEWFLNKYSVNLICIFKYKNSYKKNLKSIYDKSRYKFHFIKLCLGYLILETYDSCLLSVLQKQSSIIRLIVPLLHSLHPFHAEFPLDNGIYVLSFYLYAFLTLSPISHLPISVLPYSLGLPPLCVYSSLHLLNYPLS